MAGLTTEQLARFDRDGYLIFDNVLSEADLADIRAELENDTDEIRRSFDLRYQPVGQATGRDVFPGFVARSTADPDSVLTDADAWARLWWRARDRIVSGEVDMHFGGRWNHNATQPVCA